MRWQFSNIILTTLFCAILISVHWFTVAQAEDKIVDLSHNGNGWNSFGEEVDEIKRFQTFIAAETSIGKIQVKIRYLNNVAPKGDVIAEVFETNGNLPVGDALAQGKLPKDDVVTGDVNEIILECSGLKVGKEYAIALDQEPRQNNVCYEWNNGVNVSDDLQFGKFTGTWVDESFLGDGWLKVFPGQASVSRAGKLATTLANIKNQ
jgi:hypothetical protein